ncbi:c-di-GMP-binding flagellar brake protein YcgR, contains PilZNR and PilZ domains [Anaerovirgula multivorans]|uniref:C-di-GMP-binding flagellar brake protein YcgR, contains PilZNR and PilZ domains n=1 Tax=Anaerovirgula multivorans TaxID=312168 RepID=A0A239KFT9_9FIRM|nr:PilZ domain-containing protein [Anaerovirgula multivorans]SNT15994.1 c-di-GMP-binding flagellar brake protein YcgR, contains PilZNR and PilZ domains [Anaerovirgula multivorans]
MYEKYLQPEKNIKLEIQATPPYLSFWGVIDHIKDDYIAVDITGQYVQKDDRQVNCIIPGATRICFFQTIIKGCIDGKIILSMPKPDDINVIQRRKYARVPTNIDVNCFLIGINNKKVNSNKTFPATVMDISGGGVLLNSKLSLPVDTLLVFELALENNSFVLTVKILRNIENMADGSWSLGCKFVGIDDSDRQKIIAYTNKLQLRMKIKSTNI